jgi:hypothetical protein
MRIHSTTIRNSEHLGMVMANGRLVAATTLREIGGSQRQQWGAPTMFWNH